MNKLRDLVIEFQFKNENEAIHMVNQDIDEIKGNMKKNIGKIMNNMEDADALKVESEKIKDGSKMFQQKSTDLKRIAWWQNMKMWLIIALIVIGVVLIIVIVAVVKSKQSKSTSPQEIKITIGNQ